MTKLLTGRSGVRASNAGSPRQCEFPCWQRVGITTKPCCPDCTQLDEEEAE